MQCSEPLEKLHQKDVHAREFKGCVEHLFVHLFRVQHVGGMEALYEHCMIQPTLTALPANQLGRARGAVSLCTATKAA